MDLGQKLKKALTINKSDDKKKEWISLIKRGAELKVYVVGKNEQSLELIQKYRVTAIIDDYISSSEFWYGVPVLKTEDADRKSIVVNCSTSISPVQVEKKLHSSGFSKVLAVSDFIFCSPADLTPPSFVQQQRAENIKNQSKWEGLYKKMSDDISKKTLVDVLLYRTTADPKYMKDYSVRLNDQYFEEFMEYESEVFVDAGGYDGDTTEEFITRYPDYKKVYLFEPSKKNITAAKQRLRGRRDIEFKCIGLSDSCGYLEFDSNAGSASAIKLGAENSIPVVTLDSEILLEDVSFIKMDLEGWEMNALRGSEQIIKKNKPKLAVAVYHSAKDFLDIPEYLLKINPEYQIFLRHYTQGWSETIMFFK